MGKKKAPRGTPPWEMKGTPIWGHGRHEWGGGRQGPAAGGGEWGHGFTNSSWGGGGRSLWDAFTGLFS